MLTLLQKAAVWSFYFRMKAEKTICLFIISSYLLTWKAFTKDIHLKTSHWSDLLTLVFSTDNNMCFSNVYFSVMSVWELAILEILCRKQYYIHLLKSGNSGKGRMITPGTSLHKQFCNLYSCMELCCDVLWQHQWNMSEKEIKYKEDETENICKWTNIIFSQTFPILKWYGCFLIYNSVSANMKAIFKRNT